MQMSFMNCNIKQHQIMIGVQNLLLHQVSQGCKKRRRESLVIYNEYHLSREWCIPEILQGLSGFLGTRYTVVCKFGIRYLPVVT